MRFFTANFFIPLLLVVVLMAGCSSAPTQTVTSSLGKHALKGKTLAVGGFTAKDVMTYPGQTGEQTIMSDAGKALQHRCKHSRVLTAEATWAAAGAPAIKMNSGVPITLGHRLTPDFIRRTRAQGVDYLLWIDLLENSMERASKQWISTNKNSRSPSTIRRTGSNSGRSMNNTSPIYSSSLTRVTCYHCSEFARRSVGATYSLVDTATGRTVWRTDSKLSRENTSTSSDPNGYPPPPRAPLPPEESMLLLRMTTEAIEALPK